MRRNRPWRYNRKKNLHFHRHTAGCSGPILPVADLPLRVPGRFVPWACPIRVGYKLALLDSARTHTMQELQWVVDWPRWIELANAQELTVDRDHNGYWHVIYQSAEARKRQRKLKAGAVERQLDLQLAESVGVRGASNAPPEASSFNSATEENEEHLLIE